MLALALALLLACPPSSEGAGPVQAGAVQAGAVQAGEVLAGAVQAGDVSAGEVLAGSVQAGDVQAGAVQAGAVLAGPVQAGPVSLTVESLTVEDAGGFLPLASVEVLDTGESSDASAAWTAAAAQVCPGWVRSVHAVPGSVSGTIRIVAVVECP